MSKVYGITHSVKSLVLHLGPGLEKGPISECLEAGHAKEHGLDKPDKVT